MSTADIYNFIRVNDQLLTGGQPSAEQLQAAAAEGVRIVVNLATLNPRYALPDEAGLVQSLGMAYHHLPVEWDNPQASDFETFDHLLQTLPAEKMLIHCAANFRVTAFYALYALKRLGWSAAQADTFRAPIWQGSDHPVWEKLFGELKSQILRDRP